MTMTMTKTRKTKNRSGRVIGLMMLALLAVTSGGCISEMRALDVNDVSHRVNAVSAQVDQYQQLVADIGTRLSNMGVIDEQLASDIQNLQDGLDNLQPQVISGIEEVLATEYSGDDLTDILRLIQSVNQASAPVNPYAGVADLGLEAILGVLAALGIGVGASQRKKAKTAEAKYTAHKRGVEQYWNRHPEERGELYDSIGNARANAKVL